MTKNNISLTARTARPQTLSAAFGGLMKLFGRIASESDLSSRWDEIMGNDISSIARLIAITKTKNKKFNITIRAENPAFSLQLSYMSNEIAARINKYFGYPAIDKIKIRK